MDWSNNNKACVSVWFYLAQTKQLKSPFLKAELIRMKQLRLWNDLSPEATKASAAAWAEWYISYITTKDGAQYESGYTWAKTVVAMLEVMTDETATVSDLAEAVDEAVFFHKEVKP